MGDGVGDLDDGGLLKGINEDHLSRDLAGDGDHGDGVKEGIDEVGHHVSAPGLEVVMQMPRLLMELA